MGKIHKGISDKQTNERMKDRNTTARNTGWQLYNVRRRVQTQFISANSLRGIYKDSKREKSDRQRD